MLHGIDPHLSPDILHSLALMGHGDTIAIVDANFPAASSARRLHAAHASDASRMLAAVLSLLPLDEFVPNAAEVMQVVGDAGAVPPAVAAINAILARNGAPAAAGLERFAFYAAARAAFAIIHTGEARPWGNVILRKGVIVPPGSFADPAT